MVIAADSGAKIRMAGWLIVGVQNGQKPLWRFVVHSKPIVSDVDQVVDLFETAAVEVWLFDSS